MGTEIVVAFVWLRFEEMKKQTVAARSWASDCSWLWKCLVSRVVSPVWYVST